jgi:HSP20 family protein
MSNLNRWDPFQDMLSLREAMNQLLADSFVQPSAVRGAQSFVPAIDLSETEDGFLVEAQVPGLKPEDLEITCENNVLTIKGQIQQQAEDRKRHYHRVERRFGTFERSVGLPSSVKTEAIQATLNGGILRLEIPKAENVKPRRINVNVGESKQIEVGKK